MSKRIRQTLEMTEKEDGVYSNLERTNIDDKYQKKQYDWLRVCKPCVTSSPTIGVP
jgi:hypothetical protein